MRKMFLRIFVICVLGCCFDVYATPGKLRKTSIKSCNGVTYGLHGSSGVDHWHVATFDGDSYYANGDPIYSDPCASSGGGTKPAPDNVPSTSPSTGGSSGNSSTSGNSSSGGNSSSSNSNPSTSSSGSSSNSEVVIVKSGDNTIKEISIDGEVVSFDDKKEIEISTSNDSLKLVIVLTDSNAAYKIEGNNKLKNGDNEVKVLVTAENGDKATYLIKVYKKSNDNTLKSLSIDGTSIEIKDTMEEYTSNSSVVAEIVTNDSKATYEIVGSETLVDGNNSYKIIVTAEDGSKKEYVVNIYKYSKTEDAIYSILGLGVVGGSGYGIYRLCKKKKTK